MCSSEVSTRGSCKHSSSLRETDRRRRTSLNRPWHVRSSAGTESPALPLPPRMSTRRRSTSTVALRRVRLALWHGPSASEEPDAASVAEARVETLLALRTLPLRQRQALLLVEWLDMTSDEAAQVLGIAPESVRGRVHRAKVALRERFGGNDD